MTSPLPGPAQGVPNRARPLPDGQHHLPAGQHHLPDGRPPVPQRARGVIALSQQNCTSCMVCARECPVWCITIESHTEPAPPLGPRGRPRTVNVLDRFDLDWSLCMACGICVETCPFDALFWAPVHDEAGGTASALVHDKDRLAQWLPQRLSAAVPRSGERAAADRR